MTTSTPEPVGSIFVTHEGACRSSYDKAALAREIVRLGGHLGKSGMFEVYLAPPKPAFTVTDAEVQRIREAIYQQSGRSWYPTIEQAQVIARAARLTK